VRSSKFKKFGCKVKMAARARQLRLQLAFNRETSFLMQAAVVSINDD
jgi:hypothetical protein